MIGVLVARQCHRLSSSLVEPIHFLKLAWYLAISFTNRVYPADFILSKSLPTHDVRIITLKHLKYDGGLLAFRRKLFWQYARFEGSSHLEKEFNCKESRFLRSGEDCILKTFREIQNRVCPVNLQRFVNLVFVPFLLSILLTPPWFLLNISTFLLSGIINSVCGLSTVCGFAHYTWV